MSEYGLSRFAEKQKQVPHPRFARVRNDIVFNGVPLQLREAGQPCLSKCVLVLLRRTQKSGGKFVTAAAPAGLTTQSIWSASLDKVV
jgi:hypothetical protein